MRGTETFRVKITAGSMVAVVIRWWFSVLKSFHLHPEAPKRLLLSKRELEGALETEIGERKIYMNLN